MTPALSPIPNETANTPVAFALRDLAVLNYSLGFTLWFYRSGHHARLRDICAPDFFRDAGQMLQRGDMIVVSASDGGTILIVSESLIDPISRAVTVNVSGLTPIPAAD